MIKAMDSAGYQMTVIRIVRFHFISYEFVGTERSPRFYT